MEYQPELGWGMRTKLVSWIMQVHDQFKFSPETLYITVNLIDRFLSSKSVSLSKLQLVGISSLLVAAKYEEIQSPSIADLVYMVDGCYTANEILDAEKYLLGVVKFQIGYPHPLNFIRKFAITEKTTLELIQYFCTVTLLDEAFFRFPSSVIASSCVFLGMKVICDSQWVKYF